MLSIHKFQGIMFKIFYSQSEIKTIVTEEQRSCNVLQNNNDPSGYMIIIDTNRLIEKIINAVKRVIGYLFNYKQISLSHIYSLRQNNLQNFIDDPFSYHLMINPTDDSVIATEGNPINFSIDHQKALTLVNKLKDDPSCSQIAINCLNANNTRSSIPLSYYSVKQADIDLFITRPDQYFLIINDDGSIKAITHTQSSLKQHNHALSVLKDMDNHQIYKPCYLAEMQRVQKQKFAQRLQTLSTQALQVQQQIATSSVAPLLEHLQPSFASDIDRWSCESQKGKQENRAEAARRMKIAYETNASQLDLSGLDLQTLPPAISGLRNLKVLIVKSNKQLVIPSELNQWLPHLQRLIR